MIEDRFPAERDFCQSWMLLPFRCTWVGIFAERYRCQPSVVLTALGSRWRRGGRIEFCDSLVCPEFPLKRRLLLLVPVRPAAQRRLAQLANT